MVRTLSFNTVGIAAVVAKHNKIDEKTVIKGKTFCHLKRRLYYYIFRGPYYHRRFCLVFTAQSSLLYNLGLS